MMVYSYGLVGTRGDSDFMLWQASRELWPDVKLNTTYSYGLDDQEFVVAFEGDYPGRFVDLLMALRLTEASLYTERDVPAFTARALSMRDTLDSIG